MHKLLLLATFLLCGFAAFSQIEMGFGYIHQQPQGNMAANIPGANGFQYQLGYRLPTLPQLVLSLDLGTSRYGMQKISQTFQNADMPVAADYTIRYINFSNNTHLNLRYELLKKTRVIPYVQLAAGRQTMGTRVRLNEYGPVDDCAPLENKVTFRQRRMVSGLGGGFLVHLEKNKYNWRSNGGLLLYVSVSYMQGGNIDYVNVKQLEEVNTSNTTPGVDDKPLTTRFTTVSTGNIHQHTVARIHNDPLRQLQFRVGILSALGKD